MNLLNGHRVLALTSAADSALPQVSWPRWVRRCSRSTAADMGRNLADASFLVEGMGPAKLAEQGWTTERLQRAAPHLIHVSVTTFGADAPRAHWLGGELIASAMGGVLRLTGTTDRPPVKEALDACQFHADMVAAAGALAAHYERGITGRGQLIDVSVQEVAFSRQFNSVLAWQFDRRKLSRVGGALNYGIGNGTLYLAAR